MSGEIQKGVASRPLHINLEKVRQQGEYRLPREKVLKVLPKQIIYTDAHTRICVQTYQYFVRRPHQHRNKRKYSHILHTGSLT